MKINKRRKHCSEETKRKISEANKGKIVSEETKKKLADAHRGIHPSEETKRKMSESRKGMKYHKKTKKTKKNNKRVFKFEIEGGEILEFKTFNQFIRYFQITYSEALKILETGEGETEIPINLE